MSKPSMARSSRLRGAWAGHAALECDKEVRVTHQSKRSMKRWMVRSARGWKADSGMCVAIANVLMGVKDGELATSMQAVRR